MKQTMFWLTVYLGALGLATGYGFWVDYQQDIDACNRSNELVQESVRIGGESIIEAASTVSDQPPSQDAIDAYKEIYQKNIQEALEDC